jgi:hypothetical protein
LEIRINKEVRNYQESLFFGLSLRQLLFALLAVAVAVGVYFGLRPVLGNGEIGWVCVLAAFPFALGGFFQYNGMTLERFLLAYIRTEFIYPHRLVFQSDNLYAKLMERSSMKEALKID